MNFVDIPKKMMVVQLEAADPMACFLSVPSAIGYTGTPFGAPAFVLGPH